MNGRAKTFFGVCWFALSAANRCAWVLTVLAVALGVAVVLAIDLAGTAATGSFSFLRSKRLLATTTLKSPPPVASPKKLSAATPSRRFQ